MTKSARQREQRDEMWRRDPYCFWCGTRTILPPNEGPKRKKFLPTEATLDHLHSRWSKHRQNGGKGKHVLACRACNQRRDREEMKLLMQKAPEEVWQRTGAYPLGHERSRAKRGNMPEAENAAGDPLLSGTVA